MFPWVIIHNIKPNHVDYYHIEGFWDCSMYVRNKYGVKIHTWVETPCSYGFGEKHFRVSPIPRHPATVGCRIPPPDVHPRAPQAREDRGGA